MADTKQIAENLLLEFAALRELEASRVPDAKRLDALLAEILRDAVHLAEATLGKKADQATRDATVTVQIRNPLLKGE